MVFDQEEQGQVKQVLVKALEHNIEFWVATVLV